MAFIVPYIKNHSKFLVIVFLLALLALYFPLSITAESSPIISFQGKIVEKTNGTNLLEGSPSCILEGADTCDFRASIYSDSIGGTLLWREPHLNIEIGDFDGVFNLDLNSICSSWESPTGLCSGSGINWGQDPTVYLEIQFDDDGNGDFINAETFTRKLFSSVPFAYEAQNLNGISSDGFIQIAPNAIQDSGEVTNPLVFLNETSSTSPHLMQLQVGGLDRFVLSNSGNLTLAGDFVVEGGDISSTSSVLRFNDVNTQLIPFSDSINYQLPLGTNSLLHAINAAFGGGGGLWTISGNVTYLSSSAADLSLSNTLVSAFSVDQSENLTRIGSGSSTNGKLDFYSSTGDTGRFEYIVDTLQWSGGSLRIADDTPLIFGTNNDIQFFYDEVTDNRLEVSNGTDLLLALKTNGTVGDLVVTGVTTVGGSIINLGSELNDSLGTVIGAGLPTSELFWGNQKICLENESGCSSDFGLFREQTFNGGLNTATVENNNDVIIGTYNGDTTPLTNTNFVLDSANADDLYVTDLVGVGDSLFVQNQIQLGAGGLVISDSGISDSNSNLTLSSGYGVVLVNDSLQVTTGDILLQDTTARNIINDNSTVGSTANSGAYILRGNFFNGTNNQIDMRFLLNIASDTDYKMSFYNNSASSEIASLDESGNLQIDGKLQLGEDTNDVLGVGASSTSASGDLFFGDDLICDVSEPNCGLAFGGASLFTDGGSISYLSQTSDNFAVGALNTLVAPFSVSVAENLVRIGDGIDDTNDPTLMFYASDGVNNGSISLLDNGTFNIANADVFISSGDLLVGSQVESINSASFTLDGISAFISGQLGVEGSIYTDGNLFLQTDVDTTGAGDIAINFGGINTEEIAWRASLDGFEITNDFLPSQNDLYTLGSNTRRWGDLFIGPQTLHIGTAIGDEGTISYNTTTNDLLIASTGDVIIQNTSGRVGIGGVTAPNALLDLAPSTTNYAQLNFSGGGVNPSVPVAGDFWFTGTELNFYDGSTTVDILSAANNLWGENGSTTYLVDTNSDFALGGNASTAPYFFDKSAGRLTLNVTGATAGIVLGNDTLLYDAGADLLATPDSLQVGGRLSITSTGSSGGLIIGDDTNLYDAGVNTIRTDDSFIVGGGLNVYGSDVLIQGTTPLNLIIDNSTAGVTASSGAVIFKGNYFDTTDVEIGMRLLLNVNTDTDYTLGIYDNTGTNEVASFDQSGNLQLDGNINIGSDPQDKLGVGSIGQSANGDLYWGDDLLCDASEPNCGIAFGGSSLFTDSGSLSYLTQTADDFAVGGSSLASALSVDVSENAVRIGSGTGVDASLTMFSGANESGVISFVNGARWEFSGGDVLIEQDQNLYFGTTSDFFIGYDALTDSRLEFGMNGNYFGSIDDVASQVYGAFIFNGTTTLGTALAENETALYINPLSGFTGNLLDLDIGGSDIFTVSATGIRAEVPATFASVGDVQIANNLVFTNSTASHITSDSPMYITAGDVVSDEDLILSARNNGYVIVDDRLEVADLIHLGNGSAANYLATSAQSASATDDLFWGDKLICDASEVDCGYLNFFTDSGSVTYITDIAEDFAVGGTSLAGSFSVDVSENLVKVGTGSSTNGKIDIYSQNGNSARLELTIADVLELNNAGFHFNQIGEAVDFTIEGDTDSYLFYTQGTTDRVGIGVSSPDAFLDIKPATSGSAQINLSASSGINPTTPVAGDLWFNGSELRFFDGTNVNNLLGSIANDLTIQNDQDTTLAGDITLNFGGTNSETIKWDSGSDLFAISDDIAVSGSIFISGSSASIVYANVSSGNAPLCDSSTVGTTIYSRDASEDGTLYLCRQNASDNYEWRDVSNGSGTPDIAEFVLTENSSIQAGDIVSVSDKAHFEENVYNRFFVELANQSNRDKMMGIISENPGLILNPSTPKEKTDKSFSKPLALAGRVFVNLSQDSEDIKAGDPITASAQPGKAEKAVNRGFIVGTALEDWTSASGNTKILVFINNSWYEPDAGPNAIALGNSGKGIVKFNELTNEFEFDADGDGIAEISLNKNSNKVGDVLEAKQIIEKTIVQQTIYNSNINLESNTFETYPTLEEQLTPGDVLSFASIDDKTLGVVKTADYNSMKMFAVKALNSKSYLDNFIQAEEKVSVVTSGVTPVRVSDENGLILRGDFLTKSEIPGFVAKATKGSMVIGRALEDFDPSLYGKNDSKMVKEYIVEQKQDAYDILDDYLKNGIISEDASIDLIIDEMDTNLFDDQINITEIETLDPNYALGRILVYVNANFISNEVFNLKEENNSSLEINSFIFANGDNLFETIDNPESTTLRINVEDLIVAGALIVEGDLTVAGSIFAPSIQTGELNVSQKLNITNGTDTPAGKVVLPKGSKSIEVKNSIITKGASVYLTPNQFVEHRVSDIKEGIGFTIEIKEEIEFNTEFDYLIVN